MLKPYILYAAQLNHLRWYHNIIQYLFLHVHNILVPNNHLAILFGNFFLILITHKLFIILNAKNIVKIKNPGQLKTDLGHVQS